MKKTVLILMSIITGLLLITCLFWFMKWPGKNMLVMMTLMLAWPAMALAFVQHFLEKRNVVFMILGLLTGTQLLFGLLFKINHYPGASYLLIFGLVLAVAGSIALLLTNRRWKDPARRIAPYQAIGFTSLVAVIFLTAIAINNSTSNDTVYRQAVDNGELCLITDSMLPPADTATLNRLFPGDSLRQRVAGDILKARTEIRMRIQETMRMYTMQNDEAFAMMMDQEQALKPDGRSLLKYSGWSSNDGQRFLLGDREGSGQADKMIRACDEYGQILCVALRGSVLEAGRSSAMARIGQLLDFETPYTFQSGRSKDWADATFSDEQRWSVISTFYQMQVRCDLAALTALQCMMEHRGEEVPEARVE